MGNKIISSPIEILSKHYGYNQFRDGQEQAISNVLSGKDGLFVRATGGGKSLTYQVPSLCMEGTAVIISPLIALMKDQAKDLKQKGIQAAFINSDQSNEEQFLVMNGMRNGGYKMVYVSPERLNTDEFMQAMAASNISFVAIDEAHCVSTWGQDFRPSFRKIVGVLDTLEKETGKRYQRYACTATATPLIQRDIVEQLGMKPENSFIDVGSFDRPNIEFNVLKSNHKISDIADICKSEKEGSVIIYCSTVRNVEQYARQLNNLGVDAIPYHGRMNPVDKERNQNNFSSGKNRFIVATNAFGMGVDKSDVRHVIHASMPGTIENYYQEAGRGGRDGDSAKATMLYSKNDRKIHEFLIKCSYPDKRQIRAVQTFLATMGGDEVLNFKDSEISQIAPTAIEDFQVGTILRILEDNDLIELLETNDDSRSISVKDSIDRDVDFSYVDTRRRVMTDNLNLMERFSNTNRCLRTFILNYFENENSYDSKFGNDESHSCGNCGSCLDREISKNLITSKTPEAAVKSALSITSNVEGRSNYNTVVDLLIGTKSKVFETQGSDKLGEYGGLSHWGRPQVKALLDKLIEGEYIAVNKINMNNLDLTPKGYAVLNGMEKANVSMAGADKSIEMTTEPSKNIVNKASKIVFDKDLFINLNKLRSNLSLEFGQNPLMIMSDKVMKNIATVKPESPLELEQVGLSRMKVGKYGEQIFKLIEENEAKIQNLYESENCMSI